MLSVLCIADAHLGRYPTRIPPEETALSVHAVWAQSIDYAIKHKVDAVALTGDIVDSKNRFFEAYGTLSRGIERLANHGIAVYAVAGNHDHDVLPRLLGKVDHGALHLLGRQGAWESAPLYKGGALAAIFCGWSFPAAHYESSPLASFSAPQHDAPIIGLAHGDLDAAQSRYAPLSRTVLQRHPVTIWLLGHIHAPQWIPSGGAPILYPGSLQPLDPGESGQHGPWLIRISDTASVEASQIPLASVRYEPLEIDVSDISAIEELQDHVSHELSRDVGQKASDNKALRHVVYRITLTGRTKLHRTLVKRPLRVEDVDLSRDELRATVDKITVDTVPKHDLAVIAGFTDPPAKMAQWLLQLEKAVESDPLFTEECEDLIGRANDAVLKISRSSAYAHLSPSDTPPDRRAIARLLLRQGRLLLDELMGQREQA